MLGRTIPELIFIRASITALRSIAPLSILYVPLRLWCKLPAPPLPLDVWMFSEALFCLGVYLPLKRYCQGAAVHPVLLPRQERRALFEQCLEEVKDLDAYLSGWFDGAAAAEVWRGNVADFLRWAFLNAGEGEEEGEVEEYVSAIENKFGIAFPHGRNLRVRCLRLTVDPVEMGYRPLVWYSIVSIVDVSTSLRLSLAGFRHFSGSRWYAVFPPRPQTVFSATPQGPTSYWLRPHTDDTKLPVVFVHGIGIGLYPYVPFLKELAAKLGPGVGIIAIEILPISMRIGPRPPTSEEFCAQTAQILATHGITRFVLVSHSYGTALSTHLLHSPTLAPLIAALVLVDPISLLLHLPDVAGNFVHKPPRHAAAWLIRYFSARDCATAWVLARHFFWHECVLWKEELDSVGKVAVVFSGRDLIVDSDACWRYLTGVEVGERDTWCGRDGRLTVLWFGALDHSQVFDGAGHRARVVELVEEFAGGM